MAVITGINQQALTSNLNLSTEDFTLLTSQVSFTLLASATISIDAYALGLDPSTVEMQLLVDGNVVYDGEAARHLMLNVTLGSGNHTVNFQALAFNTGTVATTRGIRVMNLTTGI